MKRSVVISAIVTILAAGPVLAQQVPQAAYNFGDFKSSTLTTKAWGALAQADLDAVLAYTNKCLELYAVNAREMQGKLTAYPSGNDQEIFAQWALNDVATSLFIQGEAYMKAGNKEAAKAAYEAIVKDYSFGQTYDVGSKSFWKPAEAAKEKVMFMEKGLSVDFGDMKSSTLVNKAWAAFSQKDLALVGVYVEKLVGVYGETAKEMKSQLKDYVSGSDEAIFAQWALNDVATGYFILGETYRVTGDEAKAKSTFQTLVNDYTFGQTYDPDKKLFWKPAEAAKEKIVFMDKKLDIDFGDMTSAYLVKKGWEAMGKKDIESLKVYVNKALELYGQRARDMQLTLKEFPWESTEKIHSYWALNDVGTSLFQLGQAYRDAGMNAEALATFKDLAANYGFAQCWDPQGWFWKPAEAAQQQIIEIEAKM